MKVSNRFALRSTATPKMAANTMRPPLGVSMTVTSGKSTQGM
ncbi:MAG TPA: hypothetical protein VGJ62_13700 [Gemmatimonadaceae bacterium]